MCLLQLAASLPHFLKLFFPHPGKGEAELNSWHRQGECQSHMLTQSIKDGWRPKSSTATGMPWQRGVPEKWFWFVSFVFVFFPWSVEVWSVKLWEWAGDSRIGWKLAAPKQNGWLEHLLNFCCYWNANTCFSLCSCLKVASICDMGELYTYTKIFRKWVQWEIICCWHLTVFWPVVLEKAFLKQN